MDIEKPDLLPRTSNFPLQDQSHASYTVWQAISNIFTITSIAAFLVTCICLAFERTKFLRSDDPFIIGAIVACIVGFNLTVLHLICFKIRNLIKSVLCFMALMALPAIFCIGYDCVIHLPEGQGALSIAGVAMLLCSVLVFPLKYIRISNLLGYLACFSVFLCVMGYLITYFRIT